MEEPELVTELIREERPINSTNDPNPTGVIDNSSGEWTKFLVLLIVIGTILLIVWLLIPIIFNRIVPTVLGLEETTPQVVLPAAGSSDSEETTANPEDIGFEPAFIDGQEIETLTEEGEIEIDEPAAEADTAITSSVPSSAEETAGEVAYTVRPGDTIISISEAFDISPVVLATYNEIVNPNNIQAGTIIRIPSSEQ